MKSILQLNSILLPISTLNISAKLERATGELPLYLQYGDLIDLTNLFSIASLLNHSCLPNVTYNSPLLSSKNIQFIALKTIEKGDELTISYFEHEDVTKRRNHLYNNYYFKCNCPRCLRELHQKKENII